MEDDRYKMAPFYEDLFKPKDEQRNQHPVMKMFFPCIGGTVGFLTVICANVGFKRPMFSGIQKHIVATSLGLMFGEGVRRFAHYKAEQRDMILRYYIATHPDDFPEPERVKYRDVFDDWHPVR